MKKGIDVSYHQRDIDWEKVKASGIDFAIIRAGYGRTTIDKCFKENVEECIRLGIPFGVYWFIYGVNEAEAIKNADKCHAAIAPYKNYIGLKVWCDLEYDTDNNARKRGVVLTKNVRTAMVVAFCERMKHYGYEVGNYANPDYLKTKFGDLSRYPLWLAKYSDTKGNYDCFMWQYSSKGKVNGIKGNVDMNYLYGEDLKVVESEYYPKYTGKSIFVDTVLAAIGVPEKYIGTWAKRKPLAIKQGIENYRGSAAQNRQIISLAKQGKLKK